MCILSVGRSNLPVHRAADRQIRSAGFDPAARPAPVLFSHSAEASVGRRNPERRVEITSNQTGGVALRRVPKFFGVARPSPYQREFAASILKHAQRHPLTKRNGC